MKFLKIGDWHLGVKQDDVWIQNIQLDGVRQAIQFSKENNIKKWLQAGDVFDVRKAITHKTMQFARQIFNEIAEAGIHVYVLVGNHDMTFKEKIHPNACSELLGHLDNVTVIDEPITLTFDNLQVDMIPWICDENRSDILEFIKESNSKYCMGHFELNGFYFYKGLKSHGAEPDFLKEYKRVWSGHFHTISENKNVSYIGTPWTLTAGDENDVRGWWVFDTTTEESQFIKNANMWHRKIFYPSDDFLKISDFKNLSVRVHIEKHDNKFTKFENELESVVHELKIIQKIDTDSDFLADETDDKEIKSLIELIDAYIDETDHSDNVKDHLKNLSKELYLGVL